MERKVIKRSGNKVEYDGNKIVDAIYEAMLACKKSGEVYRLKAQSIEAFVRSTISELTDIELIQDIIETQLMKDSDLEEVAKCFIIYRYEHAENRVIEDKRLFIEDYKKAKNASSGSKYDANANVEHKNIATLSGELNKRENILVNRKLLTNKIAELYGQDLADEYIRQLKSHEIYKHDETSIMPYCVSINMYPFIKNGLKGLGGHSSAPTHLQSFNGSFINLVFAVASQFAGAVATPEYLMYLDYFIRKDYGDLYYEDENWIVDISSRERTIRKVIEDSFQQVVYSMNQPAAARSFQSVFWNIGYFDKYYFESMFESFRFPDGSKPQWESLDWLQRCFMKWFNNERTKTPLTFPVETLAMLTEDGDIKDKSYAEFASEMYAEGHSFFTYLSDSADSLASCCRLRNEVASNDFSFSLGAGGVATGSKSVMTMNLNRLIQNVSNSGGGIEAISDAVREQTLKIHKYQTAYNEIMKENFEAGLLPVYDAGYIFLEKQYLTIGVNGLVEGAEFLGYEITPNDSYQNFIQKILQPIYEENLKAKMNSDEIMFNTECVPAENLGVKHANWDRQDGYWVPRDVYNSYFYVVEDDKTNIIDKIKLHGESSVKYLDGGSAAHLNLDEHLTKDQYRLLLKTCAENGTNYFTFNIPNTVCNDCGNIDKNRLSKCPACNSENLDYLTRVIGYLKRVSSFSLKRQEEESRRKYDTLR